jgi:hypothetical protein
MEKTDPTALLKAAIQAKTLEHEEEGKLLKAHFHVTYESLKPVNMLKSAIKNIITAPDLKANLVNSAIGMAAGFLAKKLVTVGSNNPLVKLFGVLAETFVANGVTKNADEIRSAGGTLLKKVITPGAPGTHHGPAV